MSIKNMRGADSLFKKLDNISDSGSYVAMMDKLCRKVERTAKELCPRKTGNLKRSITHEVNIDGRDVVGVVGTNTEYAPYVEFGTGKFAAEGNGRKTPWAYTDEATGELIWTAGQKPQPFLHPALDAHRGEIRKELGKAVRIAAKE